MLDLTLLPTAFDVLLSYRGGEGDFLTHSDPLPRKQRWNNLIDLKFGTGNFWHRTIPKAKSQLINSSMNKSSCYEIYPGKSDLMVKSFFMVKNGFLDPKLYSNISAIFNKNKNFHVCSFP